MTLKKPGTGRRRKKPSEASSHWPARPFCVKTSAMLRRKALVYSENVRVLRLMKDVKKRKIDGRPHPALRNRKKS